MPSFVLCPSIFPARLTTPAGPSFAPRRSVFLLPTGGVKRVVRNGRRAARLLFPGGRSGHR
ncbi:hypothetical protein SA87_09585 [Hydrogenibacillus schlegelii]|uniref:Uncharacterized protein n=1 Tax=Hydrogenibacillus schlegelii TaxID=1484 RepID=A0A179IPY6_HYDSH|nr:hypothetical protein SA87_09585 [Hydrogenibacillus schlegelii]